MVEVVEDLAELPIGAHAVGFYSSATEAADQAAAFLAGTPRGQSAAYWVSTEGLRRRYSERHAERASHADFGVLPEGQVRTEGETLRPVAEVRQFVSAHPEGVTAAGDTLTDHMTSKNTSQYIEYEAWFDRQPRGSSRFLCPYDLRRLPPERAVRLVRELGSSHSHVALSNAEDPAMRLLQLFVFPTVQSVPNVLRSTLGWALAEGYLLADMAGGFDATPRGQKLIAEWSRSMTGGA